MSDAIGQRAGSASHPEDDTAALARSPGAQLEVVTQAERKGVPFLLYRDGADKQCVYALEHTRAVTIGRGAEVDVRLAWDPSVSSVHAEAIRLGAYWLISDEGLSRNGTFVNNERLSGRRRLRDGDHIRVGRTVLSFNDARAERRTATTIADSAGTTGTVTLLFTDLVGSTELMDRLGDDASERVRRELFALLREAAGEHGGQEIKSLGDGLMVAFASALSAVACAAQMQQRVAAYNEESGGAALGLRIGLNAGEAISVEDDYFGTPVVVAKRLCDAARPGQTLLAEVVRALIGSRGGHRFGALGTLQLKGLSDPLTAFELDWRAQDSAAQSGSPEGSRR